MFAFGDNVLYCCNKNLVLLTTEDRLRVLDSHHLSFLELDMCYVSTSGFVLLRVVGRHMISLI